jgi:hypothetical protein
MTENPDRTERALELLLYAPVGFGAFLLDSAPALVDMFIARGRAEIDRRHGEVQQRVTTARSLGEVVMAFGPPIARQRVERTVNEARSRAEGLFASPAADEAPAAAGPPPAPEPASTPAPTAPTAAAPPLRFASAAAPVTNGDGASSAELPIPGYDALSASQVVERLIGLTPGELAAVHAYETAHRQRRTILGKIEQLAG